MKIGNLGEKMRKDDFVASPVLGEGRILGRKLGSIKKFSKFFYRY